MATVTLDAAGPGLAATRPVYASNPRAIKLISGKFSFDSSYPTGGESLSGITDHFRECLGIMMDQPIIVGAQTGKFLKVSGSGVAWNALLFTNAAPFVQVANGSDQSLVVDLKFLAWGYA